MASVQVPVQWWGGRCTPGYQGERMPLFLSYTREHMLRDNPYGAMMSKCHGSHFSWVEEWWWQEGVGLAGGHWVAGVVGK